MLWKIEHVILWIIRSYLLFDDTVLYREKRYYFSSFLVDFWGVLYRLWDRVAMASDLGPGLYVVDFGDSISDFHDCRDCDL